MSNSVTERRNQLGVNHLLYVSFNKVQGEERPGGWGRLGCEKVRREGMGRGGGWVCVRGAF